MIRTPRRTANRLGWRMLGVAMASLGVRTACAAGPPVLLPPVTPEVMAVALTEAASEEADAVASEVDELTKRIESLEKSLAKQAAPAPAADVPADKWNIKLGGHIQMDFVQWASADNPAVPDQNYFEFRRLRLLADGLGYSAYDFRLQIDIEPEGEDNVTTPVVVVKDAYFSANDLPVADRWRIGNFFVPFSLEQVTNDTNNIFVERSIPTQGIFAADREVGMALYGVNDEKTFTWTGGVFFDSISEATKERVDDNQGHRLSGRLTWLPYYDECSGGKHLLHLGTGVLYTDDQDDLVRFSARPQVHEGPRLIDSGLVPATSYTSGNVEMALVNGPFSCQSELFVSSVDRIGAPEATLTGAYVYVSYFLTGESRVYERFGQHGAQFGRNKPSRNFLRTHSACGPGAWEVKARHSHLNLNDLAAGEYNDLTVGFNWYWTDRVRIMFDWIHPTTTASTTPFGETNSDLLATRFDVNW